MYRHGLFSRCSRWSAYGMGHPVAFGLALAVIVAWAALGPIFHFSDTWQLVINTGTTIVTFLMVFLIQNTQNHQGDAIQLKLDELIRAVEGAHNMLVDLEDASEEELKEIKERYRRLRDSARRGVRNGVPDTDSPEVMGQGPGVPGSGEARAAEPRSSRLRAKQPDRPTERQEHAANEGE
jgi:low affinity Fe/Cu permease